MANNWKVTCTNDDSKLTGEWYPSDGIKFSLTKFVNNTQRNVGLLPAVTRWISPRNDLFIIERAPCRQTITYVQRMRNNVKGATRHLMEISLPWQIYIVKPEQQGWRYKNLHPDIFFFVRNERLTSLEDDIFLYPLPNLRDDGSGCLPYDATFDNTLSLGMQVMDGINRLWASGFNENVPGWHTVLKPKNLKTIPSGTDMVKKCSEATVREVLTWKYQRPKYNKTLRSWLEDNHPDEDILADLLLSKIQQAR